MKTLHVPAYTAKIRAALPDVMAHVPSMMSREERALLIALARGDYRGDGLIIDAGVFCGASTLCLGAGIMGNAGRDAIFARWPKPIHTYEYGVVNPGMIPFFERHGVKGDWRVGDSFETYLRGNIAPVAPLVELHMGDIAGARWAGEPIEIMFLDVLKSREIQHAVMRTFLPSLMPGGILIQQDYFIDGVPFVKLFQERLADHFEYLGEIQSSAVFRLVRTVPADLLDHDPLGGLSVGVALALLDQARDRSVDPDRRLMCDLGKVRYLAELRDYDAALALIEALRAQYPHRFAEGQPARIVNAIRAATNRAHGRVQPRAGQ